MKTEKLNREELRELARLVAEREVSYKTPDPANIFEEDLTVLNETILEGLRNHPTNGKEYL